MRALVDVDSFIALARDLHRPKDRAEFMDGFLAGLTAECWEDGTATFSDGQAAGIAALGEARKRGVAW